MSDYMEKLVSIQKNAEEGNLELAFQDCESIIADWPHKSEALHLSAYILILRGLPEQAIPRLLTAISSQQDNAGYHATLAIAYQSDGKLQEACASYRRVLELNPDDQETLIALADIISQKGIDPAKVIAAKGTSLKVMGYLISKSLEYAERATAIGSDHAGAVWIDKMLHRHLQENVFKVVDAAVPDDIGRGKHKVIYSLRVTGRIGHLISEPFLLKCLYDPDEYDIIILTLPRDAAISGPVFDISMRQTFPVELEPKHPALKMWGINCGIHTIDDRTYVLDRIGDLAGRVLKNLKGGDFPHRYSLNEEELDQGQKLRREMGIPPDAPIVTLYVREMGFFPSLTYHSIRNGNIDNYLPAVKYLTDEGFYVVRIGDDKMHRLPDMGPQVIDAPFHKANNKFVELYFVSQSTFMLKTISGPDNLSITFGVPSLLTNMYWTPIVATIKDDLCIPKKYYSHRYRRNLTLSEIADDKKLLFSGNASDFTARHIELLENTEEEILAATQEMISRLRGEHQENVSNSTRFRNLCQRIHNDSKNDIYSDYHMELDADYFGPHLSRLNISDANCEFNPDFLW